MSPTQEDDGQVQLQFMRDIIEQMEMIVAALWHLTATSPDSVPLTFNSQTEVKDDKPKHS
ncbi:hypothetical protein [Shewanella sp. CG12_big_fil_rev_8_21_14_0_65_47_15]|uniref:hypothetical protein n=1 Tax=Shewanella sp. CG12_big_fil_rev_8_21_14_0_65_47_15 TaxID=1975537 RepID=UPI000CB8D90F|nr:hypothetical protein [Shewanella sp. CG12_big_fil_rev_8_21_14_0_65_47_15]PIW59255.1 MAG: hypothetical protein COW15_18480 [Shewanella sp. CG12_big_fil_rev_8_21_14_0_65_47_15]